MSKARLAIDIGGTFTDVLVEQAGRRTSIKTLTTPQAPEEGLMRGAREALSRAGLGFADLSVVIHGTTLATNALIERRGAKTAFLTTEGHRDVLEMAHENRFEQYDVNIDRPEPLVPRWLRLPVRERMNFRGEILTPLDASSVQAHFACFDEEGIESVAIGFLHAYANRAHEEQAAEIVARARPDLSITMASETAPEIREFERFSTAVANAYVKPVMERYLNRVESELRAEGAHCPFLLISSGGGWMNLETAAKFPIRLVESGPAGGAVLAAAIAKQADARSLLSFDMGGTTAKLCLIDEFQPRTARAFEVDRSYRFKKGSGLPVLIPVIDMVEIGAGGGSIASIDALGRVNVGPESAGSEPGPVAYGRGGAKPTVTDADIATGKISPEGFAGGAISLDGDAARSAIDAAFSQTAMRGDDAAFAIAEVVDENMASAARAHAVEIGESVAARTMIAFGGAAPLHAARLAEKLSIDRVIVPADAGVGSAVGFLLAPAAYEVVRSRPLLLEELQEVEIDALLTEMRAEAASVVRSVVGEAPLTETVTAFMRYRGQGHEIATPATVVSGNLRPRLRSEFERNYARLYGRTLPGAEIEVMTWTLSLQAKGEDLPVAPPAPRKTFDGDAPIRRVFDPVEKRRLDYALHERLTLGVGASVDGPALIREAQTTTVVTSAYSARVDANLNLILERKARS